MPEFPQMLPHQHPTVSYWTRFPISLPCPSPSPQPSTSFNTEIVILGSGITAVSVAYTLLALTPGTTRIRVLEARSPCDGATGRNGGHCKVVPYEELAKLVARFGEERAVELVRFQLRHLACLRELCRLVDHEAKTNGEGEDTQTEWRSVETVDIFMENDVFQDAKTKVALMRRWMPEVGVIVWDADEARERFGLNHHCCGAISYKAGALFPYRLITKLWIHLLRLYGDRLTVDSNTPALNIALTSSSPPYCINTDKGTFSAHHIVHATNAYATHLLPSLRPSLVPVRAHLTAQDPGADIHQLGGGTHSWSVIYRTGFDYVSQRRGGQLLVGGGWSRSAERGADAVGTWDDSKMDPFTTAHLTGILPTVFGPDRFRPARVDSVWTGIIAVTGDGLPFVGRLEPSTTGRVRPPPPENTPDSAQSEESPGESTEDNSKGNAKSSAETNAKSNTESNVKSNVDNNAEGNAEGNAEPNVENNAEIIGGDNAKMPPPAEWISAGYNGEGMVFAWLCGTALAVTLAGKEDADLPPRPGVPGGKLASWFPRELYVSSDRLGKAIVSKDPTRVFSWPVQQDSEVPGCPLDG